MKAGTPPALYMFTFPDGKQYVGIARYGTQYRLKRHLRCVRSGSRLPVHCHLRRHGVENVRVQTLLHGPYDYLKEMEVRCIAAFGTRFPDGLNVTAGGDANPMDHQASREKSAAAQRGRKASPETRARMSRARKGRKQSAEHVANKARAMTGKIRSAESRARMSVGQKRRVRTPEELERLAEAARKAAEDPIVREARSRNARLFHEQRRAGSVPARPSNEELAVAAERHAAAAKAHRALGDPKHARVARRHERARTACLAAALGGSAEAYLEARRRMMRAEVAERRRPTSASDTRREDPPVSRLTVDVSFLRPFQSRLLKRPPVKVARTRDNAEWDESQHKRDASGQFSKNAAGASAGAAHHAAQAQAHRAQGGAVHNTIARSHERAAKHYLAALGHHETGNETEALASHKEAASNGKEAAAKTKRLLVGPGAAQANAASAIASPEAKPATPAPAPAATPAAPAAAPKPAAAPAPAKAPAAKPAKPDNSHLAGLAKRFGVSSKWAYPDKEKGGGHFAASWSGPNSASNAQKALEATGFKKSKTVQEGHLPGGKGWVQHTEWAHPEGHTATWKHEVRHMAIGGGKTKPDIGSHVSVSVAPQKPGEPSQFAAAPEGGGLGPNKVREALAAGHMSQAKWVGSKQVKGWGNHIGDYHLKHDAANGTVMLEPNIGYMVSGDKAKMQAEQKTRKMSEALQKAGIQHEVKGGQIHVKVG